MFCVTLKTIYFDESTWSVTYFITLNELPSPHNSLTHRRCQHIEIIPRSLILHLSFSGRCIIKKKVVTIASHS